VVGGCFVWGWKLENDRRLTCGSQQSAGRRNMYDEEKDGETRKTWKLGERKEEGRKGRREQRRT